MALLNRILNGRIHRGQLTIISHLGESQTFGAITSGWPNITLRLNSANAARRIIFNPRLGLGECFMDGDVTVDGEDIMGLVELVRRNSPWENGGQVGEGNTIK